MTRTHQLKTWPEPFEAVKRGDKRYEIRVDDRGFSVGDVLHLREWDPAPGVSQLVPTGYTGREVTARVTYMTPGGAWGLPPRVCVMSIEVTNPGKAGG